MIAIVCEEGDRGAAESISRDLVETYQGQLAVQIVSASSPTPWPESVSWDDLLIVLFHQTEFPEAGRDFAAEFLKVRSEHSLVLPVSLDIDRKMPPRPVDTIKALPYDDQARGPLGRIARRVGAMLGLKLRRQDNRILISYRAVDGTRIASQLDKYLSSLGYRVWLDEARDPIDNEPTILPGSEVQEEIRRALEVSNLLLLLDTPAAAESGWIKYEVDTANANLLPILPVCFHPSGDRRKGPQFRSLRDLQRWVDIPLLAKDEDLTDEQLAIIVDELEHYLSDIFRRKCRVPFIVQREFVCRDFAWRHLNKPLFVYESSKQHSRRLTTKVLSHCSFFDQIYLPALKRVLEILTATGRANYSLYVYDGELIPEPQLRALLEDSGVERIENVIVLHHQELAALIDSNFTVLPA